MSDWIPVHSAPFERDLELSVIDHNGHHVLVFPCRRVFGGWIHAETGEPVPIHPTHWRHWEPKL